MNLKKLLTFEIRGSNDLELEFKRKDENDKLILFLILYIKLQMRFSTIYISMPIMKTSIKSGEKQERSKEAVKH